MNGLNELITVAKYWQQWSNPSFVVVVLNNRDLNMVTWEQRVLEGNPKYIPSQQLPDFSYAGYARLLGLASARIDQPDEIGTSLDAALAAKEPFVVEVISDPDVPPLPPHITARQARNYLAALAKGDADTFRMLRASVKEMFT
jgi:pyruvate dehydrogenase (quinone)